MARPAASSAPSQVSPHKRNRSNPFKALVPGQKTDSTAAGATSPSKGSPKKLFTGSRTDMDFTGTLGSHSQDLPLGEIQNGRRQTRHEAPTSSTGMSLHKRTKSAISLKSQAGSGKTKCNGEESISPLKSLLQTKKSKSSTNIAALFSRPKSRGRKEDDDSLEDRNKENLKPSSSGSSQAPTPIWAQFTSTRVEEIDTTTTVPLNDWMQSPLQNRLISAASPEKSLRKNQRSPLKSSKYVELDVPAPTAMDSRRGSRVQAVVAAYDGKNKGSMQPLPPPSPSKRIGFNPIVVESAFEALLESRNIPTDVREKMRTMEISVKADFVQKNQHSVTEASDESERGHGTRFSPMKPSFGDRLGSTDSVTTTAENKESPKKSRPRSFTLTRSKNEESPTKKQRSGRSMSKTRPKSIDLPHSWSSTSLASQYSVSSPGRHAQKQTPPEEFIAYLRAVKKPQDVEVGRLQKLRQLLRNETVSWVEAFISSGGMEEIVALLHGIIQIEWREEHEDALLHHSLSCMKALATTASGLEYLATVQSALFPALLKLLFSSGEERKGPSEFTTRALIVGLLFAYLQSAPIATSAERATTLLTYLRDPEPAAAARPPDWMLGMHRPRPYKAWIGELSNVTKEVFWIFLHHHNVIPYPCLPENTGNYLTLHFPPSRPPVPAAPYVGGVEWDATNYVADHLDLMNGILASLDSPVARNELRRQLRDSGVEKVMGASLRTCKEKFYGAVHAALSTWIGAAHDDGWSARMVKEGPTREERMSGSPRKNRGKENEKPPVLGEINVGEAAPKLGLGLQVMNPDERKFLL